MEIEKLSSYVEPLGSGLYDQEMVAQTTACLLLKSPDIYARIRVSLGVIATDDCGMVVSDPEELADLEEPTRDWPSREAERFRAVESSGSGAALREYMIWHQENALPVSYHWETYVSREFSMDSITWTPAEYASSSIASESSFVFEDEAIRDAEQFLNQKILADPFYWKKLIAHDLDNWEFIIKMSHELSKIKKAEDNA